MKLTKDQVCVYIENEAQLQEARGLIEKHGEKITTNDEDFQCLDYEDNYLCFEDVWLVYDKKYPHETQITLQQLETILKEQ